MSDPGPLRLSEASEPPVTASPSFHEVYEEFHPRIRRYLSRLVGHGDAEDVTQEVFARVSQALAGFRGDSKVSTWIYRIATNVALDRLRHVSGQLAQEVAIPVECTAIEGSAIEEDLVRREMSECVRGHIQALPPNYRSVLLLSEDEGLTNQQIAEALGLTLDTVKIRLHRARARLKRELGRGCSFYRDERNELACEPRSSGVSSGG